MSPITGSHRAAYGNAIHCEHGVVVCQNAGTVTAYDRSGMVLKTWYVNRLNHHTNWAKAIRSRKSSDLTAEIMGGHVASALCHAGNISHLVGKQSTPGAMREKLSGNKLMTDAYDRMIGHLKDNKVNLDKEKLTFGEALILDPKTERFTNSEAANALLKRTYRANFVLPDKV